MALPMPCYYEPDRVSELYIERAAMVADVAEEYRKRHSVPPSARDRTKIAAFGIDCQVGFCLPGASLFVPGAVEDTQRIVRWIYENVDRISSLQFSFDTHRVFQIFHPAWWADAGGRHPAPFTPISYEDVRLGKWRPIAHPRESLDYCKKLEQTGKYMLTIWPYHTLLGGASHALVPALTEAAIFHSLVRMHQTHFETKGTHSLTENYSVLSPEVRELSGHPVGSFNAAFFRLLMDHDRVYVFGQAKSHCVLSTLSDIQKEIAATDPSLVDRIFILEDAMSPVPPPPIDPLPPQLDFPRIADRAIEDFRKAGMHVIRTTDPLV